MSSREELLATEIVDAAYKVHKELGPGLLERVYESCFCYELAQKEIPFIRQKPVPVTYKDELFFDEALRADVLVDELILCELKAVNDFNPIYTAQLISYLKLTKLRLGFLINFNVPKIKEGIRRYIV